MNKDEIVAILEEMSLMLELADANSFEVMAYRNGAEALADWDGDLAEAVEQGTLVSIRGIGKGLAQVVGELVRDGRAAKYEALREQFPERMMQMTRVPGLGPKKIRKLHERLGVDSLDALEKAARDGAIRSLPGFGAKSEERIITGVARARRYLSAG